MKSFKKFIEVATLTRNRSTINEPPVSNDEDGDDCDFDRKTIESWVSQTGWKEVGGDFTEIIMQKGHPLKSTRLEYVTPTQGGYKGLVEATARWMLGPKWVSPGVFESFLTDFKSQILASSLWKNINIKSTCINDEEFFWELLDAFANAKSKMVELWRWEKGHNPQDVKLGLEDNLKQYFKGVDINIKDIQLDKPKAQHMGDKSYGGSATNRNSSLGAYVNVKSVMWFPFKITVQ